MLTTTAGQLLINSALPPALRDYTATLDKKGAQKLLQRLAEEYPEHYRQAAHQLMQLSRRFAYESGGNSFGVSHLRPGRSTIAARRRIQEGIARALQSGQTPDERRDRINAAVDAEREPLTKALYDESLAEQNPLALQVLSGSRGNPTNLRSLRGFDGAYEDHHGNRIDIPILRNYAEGLSPAEYWASTYGARKGVIDVKSATADAGYISKQLNQAAHRLLVSDIDDPDDPDNQNRRGIPVAADDHDYVGAMLAVDHGPYKRNTALTAKIMADLRRHDFNELLVRSPIAGGPSDGGVYARDVGVRERGRLAPRGDFVGIAAAQALAEKLTQAQLSSKHSGGVAGAGPSGFALIDQLVQVPGTFRGGAAHAQRDGIVSDVREAPQGGRYVKIDGVDHYVGPDVPLKVKPGDEVEAGDVLSEGVPNPAELVKHKGIGEGRRYFANIFYDAYRGGGMGANRRNVELLTRGLINHVRLTEPWNDYAPDDVLPYHTIERNWEPRPGAQLMKPNQSVGRYLERPVLHYTVGTKIRKSMLPGLQRWGVANLHTHAEPPPFTAEMQRAATSISTDPDWMTRMIGSGQQKNLLTAVHRGDVSDTEGTSYVPSLAGGETFGKTGPTKGWTIDPTK